MPQENTTYLRSSPSDDETKTRVCRLGPIAGSQFDAAFAGGSW
jgi:hypothetical protein